MLLLRLCQPNSKRSTALFFNVKYSSIVTSDHDTNFHLAPIFYWKTQEWVLSLQIVQFIDILNDSSVIADHINISICFYKTYLADYIQIMLVISSEVYYEN